MLAGDTVGLETESIDGEPLMIPVMRYGRRLQTAESLDEIRQRAQQSFAALPISLRSLTKPAIYDVAISRDVRQLADALDRENR